MQLAGRSPGGVLCEVVNDDGSMARRPELLQFASTHGIPIISIAQLISYRAGGVRTATTSRGCR